MDLFVEPLAFDLAFGELRGFLQYSAFEVGQITFSLGEQRRTGSRVFLPAQVYDSLLGFPQSRYLVDGLFDQRLVLGLFQGKLSSLFAERPAELAFGRGWIHAEVRIRSSGRNRDRIRKASSAPGS